MKTRKGWRWRRWGEMNDTAEGLKARKRWLLEFAMPIFSSLISSQQGPDVLLEAIPDILSCRNGHHENLVPRFYFPASSLHASMSSLSDVVFIIATMFIMAMYFDVMMNHDLISIMIIFIVFLILFTCYGHLLSFLNVPSDAVVIFVGDGHMRPDLENRQQNRWDSSTSSSQI